MQRTRERRGRQRLPVALLCAWVLAFSMGVETCGTGHGMIRILRPIDGLDEIHHPLWIELDFWAFADFGTLEVLLNGVDITDRFDLVYEEPRMTGEAIDVWGAGLVLAGANTLVVRLEGVEVTRVFDTVADPHADAIALFAPGTGAGFGQSELPGVVLGGPEGLGLFQGSLDSLSLGEGGAIELEFVDNVVVDGPGVDFTVFENPFYTIVLGFVGNPFSEPGRVLVSQDGTSWYAFPCDETDPPFHPGCAGVVPVYSDALDPTSPHPSIPTEDPPGDLVGLPIGSATEPPGSGGDSFDLADVGLSWARYVRIEDVGPPLGTSGTVGFDLDAVSAVHAAVATDDNGNGTPDVVETSP